MTEPVRPFMSRIDDRERFGMLVAGVFTSAAISSNYGFNIFSNYLKDQYGFEQRELAIISTIGSVSSSFNLPAGALFDYAGAQFAIGVPCCIGSLGFILLGLTFKGVFPGTVAMFSVCNSLLCMGAGSMDTGSLMTNILNFPRDRGAVVAIQKTFTGLGSSMLVVWYRGFFEGAYHLYAFFVALEIFAFGMAGAVMIRLPPYHLTARERRRLSPNEIDAREATRAIYMTQRPSQRRFMIGYILIFVMITFLSVQSVLVVVYFQENAKVRLGIACTVVALFGCFLLMALPVRWLDAAEDRAHGTLNSDVAHSLLAQTSMQQADASPLAIPTKHQEPQYQGYFLRNLVGIDVWLLLLTSFCNWGCGNVLILNSAQIYRSIDSTFNENTNALYVALIGVGSAIGRICMGFLELRLDAMAYAKAEECAHAEAVNATDAVDRVAESATQQAAASPATKLLLITVAYPMPSAMMVAGIGLFFVLPPSAISLPFVLTSFSFGFSWASTALVVRAMFHNDVGKHYNFCFLGSLLGTTILNRFVFSPLYDQEAARAGTSPHCNGFSCVRTSFLIMLGLNCFSTATSLLVHHRFKRFVRSCKSA